MEMDSLWMIFTEGRLLSKKRFALVFAKEDSKVSFQENIQLSPDILYQ